MIKVENLEKTYYTGSVVTPVLQDLSFEIEKGEFVSIMGRSGEGKSTLLYQIGLLDTPTAGIIELNGQNTGEMGEKKRSQFRLQELGFVFQDYALLPELTAEENVMVPLMMQGKTKAEARKMARDVLKQVELDDRCGHTPSKMSGGEKQRVSVARAIANKPTILYADEPTASLDGASAHQVLEIFKKLNKEGQTIVMVTHEDEFAAYSDRILQLKNKQITSIASSKLKVSKRKVDV